MLNQSSETDCLLRSWFWNYLENVGWNKQSFIKVHLISINYHPFENVISSFKNFDIIVLL